MATDNITALEHACTEAHRAYRAARSALAAAVNKPEDSDAVAELIASTLDIGLNATLHRLNTNDPKIHAAITALSDASHRLGHAINARETAFQLRDPRHRRVYVDDGREFTLDMEKGIWTYLDDPENPIKVTLTKHSKLPYDLPGFAGPDDLHKPAKKRQPRR